MHLADGATVGIPDTATLLIRIGNRNYQHDFGIMPALTGDMLIGTDLWTRLQITLSPPPLRTKGNPAVNQITEGLAVRTPDEEQQFHDFLTRELPMFNAVMGPTPCVQHRIRLKARTEPVKQRYRPRNPAMQAIIDAELAKMEEDGVIEPSRSAWSSPIVVARKQDGKPRICIDFRKANEQSEKDAYPLPQVMATLDKLRGARYLSTLDLKHGYWQVPLTPDSRPITAFIIPRRGLMQFRVMPFGLHSAPATFQHLLDTVIGPELELRVIVYLDDIIVATRTFEGHLKTLAEVFRRLRDARLRLNVKKCQFGRDSLRYLGYIIDGRGLRTDPAKTDAVANWSAPNTVRKMLPFLGMASWYRRFIRNFSTIAAPLTRMTRKNARWNWGPEEEAAFQTLKNALTSAPVLACPDFSRRFILQTDASTLGLGSMLTQHLEEGERVIAYVSRTLNQAERNYSATELECLTVVWGIRRMREYLEGYQFTVITDHQSLRCLQTTDSPTGRLGRWKFELQQYDFDVRYRRGSANRVADALSREPEVCDVQNEPHCGWYRRLREQATHRPQEVTDYAIRERRLMRYFLHELDFREVPNEEQWKECISKEQRKELISHYHDDPAAGHLGIAKTIA